MRYYASKISIIRQQNIVERRIFERNTLTRSNSSFKLINYKDAFSVHISLQSCSTRSSISRPCYDTEKELYLKEKEKEPVRIRPISHPTRSNFPSRRVT